MKGPYGQIVGMQAAIAGQWVEMAVSMCKWYSGILDPRPDLAKRARAGGGAYGWWW